MQRPQSSTPGLTNFDQKTRCDDVRKRSELFRPVGGGDIGDIDIDTAIAGVAATFGALPVRHADAAQSGDVGFPKQGRRLEFTHEGRADQAVAYAAWPGPDFPSNPKQARTLVLLRDMIKVRLTDEFREKQGATYSPFASSWASANIRGFGYIAAGSETPPLRGLRPTRNPGVPDRSTIQQPLPDDRPAPMPDLKSVQHSPTEPSRNAVRGRSSSSSARRISPT